MSLPEKGTSSIEAVVVNHNAGGYLSACVASLRNAGIERIVVVDNASHDDSLARLAADDDAVSVVSTGRNLGYGAAANRGVALVAAPYVLICNPDLVVDPETPRRLAEVLDEERDVGAVGPRIVENDGTIYPSARAFPRLGDAIGHAFLGMFRPRNRWSDRYRPDVAEMDTDRDVDWISGACILVRRLAFSSVGGFDEGYFMYVEDLDLCWRMHRGAWRTRYVPSASIIHEQGVSSREHPYRLLLAHHASTWRFVRRSSTGPRRLLVPAIGAGIAARLGVAVAKAALHDHLRGRVRRRGLVG